MKQKEIQPILLVEDDQVDIMTVQRSFKKIGVMNRLVVRNNGEEALNYMNNPEYGVPCVIVLDINMPKMNGHEFLASLNQSPELGCIPVVMLTSSKELNDVDRSFALGVHGYILKPVDYNQFLESIQLLSSYWTVEDRTDL